MQIAAAFCPASAASSGLTKEIFEDVIEDISEPAPAEVKPVGALLGSGMAERIVDRLEAIDIEHGVIGHSDKAFKSGIPQANPVLLEPGANGVRVPVARL